MRGAIQLMTQLTGWYQVVDRAVPVNVACHVIPPGLPADSAHRKEAILALMYATDSSSISFTMCRCGSRIRPSTVFWVIGQCRVSFNHKPERRIVFSEAPIAAELVWANVLTSHRQARAFPIFLRRQTTRERILARREASSGILVRQTVPIQARQHAALP